MNLNKKMRKAALAAMITLALSGSAMAMPSGGTVEPGAISVNGANVDVSTIANVADKATITANRPSIINWDAFGIAAGETLNFNTVNGALLNRVTGNNISEILGNLNQTGGHPLLLVNPNGILVGGNAVIDASQLVLSTLAISDQDFLAFANNGVAKFTTDKSGYGIAVEKGAQINIDEVLLMAGGTVNVADGVTFSINPNDHKSNAMVEIAAANYMEVDRSKNLHDSMDNIVTASDNAAIFNGTVDSTRPNGNTIFHVDGGTVNLDNAVIKLNDNSQTYLGAGNRNGELTSSNVLSAKGLNIEGGKTTLLAGGRVELSDSRISQTNTNGDINIYAAKAIKPYGANGDNRDMAEAESDNVLMLKNTTIEGNNQETVLNAGAIILDNSTVKNNDTVQMRALKSSTVMEDGKMTADANSSIDMKDSTISAKEVYMFAGKMSAENSSIDGSKTLITATGNEFAGTSPSNLTIKRDASNTQTRDTKTHIGTLSQGSTPWTVVDSNITPSDMPIDNVVPSIPVSIPEGDKENMIVGKQVVDIILSSESSLADKQAAINTYVSKLNDATVDDRAKAAQVAGMLNELKSINTAEGNALMLTVLNSYEPTKNSKEAADEAKIAEGSAVTNQAVDTKAMQNVTGANESANDVAVDTHEVSA